MQKKKGIIREGEEIREKETNPGSLCIERSRLAFFLRCLVDPGASHMHSLTNYSWTSLASEGPNAVALVDTEISGLY